MGAVAMEAGLRRWGRCGLLAVCAGALCVSALGAQSSAGAQSAGGASGSKGQAAPIVQDEESHGPLTKDQAKELFKSVDEILKFVSADTDLPIVHQVKRRLISRDQVNKMLREKYDHDEDAKRLQRSEVVLKKFGLLDRDFNLQPFMISLLTEQVAGYYDNKTKTVNLLDWIDPEQQKPVLAHELTHALQDQRVDLTKWGRGERARTLRRMCRRTTSTLRPTRRTRRAMRWRRGRRRRCILDYSLQPMGKSIVSAPEMLGKMKDSMVDTSGSPILARAPLLLQESLTFPYSEGLSFEGAVLLKRGQGRGVWRCAGEPAGVEPLRS